MIKDVMVWVDGSLADEIRLDAAGSIARQFDSQVIALVLNSMPLLGSIEGAAAAVVQAELLEKAREAGDITEAKLVKRLKLLERPVEIRRFDVLANDIADIAAREARTADTFVALRPNGAMDPERLVEGVLFESGRHLFLFPETERPKIAFDRILVAWNGSRESARAMAEGMPFLLRQAKEVTVAVITDKRVTNRMRWWAPMPSIISSITASTPCCIASTTANTMSEPLCLPKRDAGRSTSSSWEAMVIFACVNGCSAA